MWCHTQCDVVWWGGVGRMASAVQDCALCVGCADFTNVGDQLWVWSLKVRARAAVWWWLRLHDLASLGGHDGGYIQADFLMACSGTTLLTVWSSIAAAAGAAASAAGVRAPARVCAQAHASSSASAWRHTSAWLNVQFLWVVNRNYTRHWHSHPAGCSVTATTTTARINLLLCCA